MGSQYSDHKDLSKMLSPAEQVKTMLMFGPILLVVFGILLYIFFPVCSSYTIKTVGSDHTMVLACQGSSSRYIPLGELLTFILFIFIGGALLVIGLYRKIRGYDKQGNDDSSPRV